MTIYTVVHCETKDNIQLNVTSDKVEVKTKRVYKLICLPTSEITLEKASSKYINGVLEVIILKKEKEKPEIKAD